MIAKNFKDKLTLFRVKNKYCITLIFSVAASILSISGCQTTQTRSVEAPSKPSYWVFRTSVYSAKKNKNISGYTHVTYMNPNLLRLDVYDPLGLLNFGTLIYKDGQFEAVVPMERRYFYGIASPQTMFQILKSPIEPSLFVNLIFQKKISGPGWLCSEDQQGYVRECQNRDAGIDIVWKKNISPSDGHVVVTHTEGEVDLKLRSSRSIQALPAEKFKIQVPSSYDKYKVDAGGIKKI